MTDSILGDIDYDELNPGIRDTVRVLRANGFDTCDSGDGVTHEYECDLDVPYVHIMVKDPRDLAEEADRLKKFINDHGLEVTPQNEENDNSITILATYDPADCIAMLSVFNFKLV